MEIREVEQPDDSYREVGSEEIVELPKGTFFYLPFETDILAKVGGTADHLFAVRAQVSVEELAEVRRIPLKTRVFRVLLSQELAQRRFSDTWQLIALLE